MNEPRGNESVVRDEGSVPTGQTEHERRVEDAEEASGQPVSRMPGGSDNRYTGTAAEPYEDEVAAEREGTTAEEVDGDDDTPPEAARIYTG